MEAGALEGEAALTLGPFNISSAEDGPAPDASASLLGSTKTSIFEDRREERRRTGLVKYEVERGVPDVGGLGWRSRAGHLLKNQTYYAVQPNLNLWDNPTHAGPKTWKSWHGPRLRRDAELMERLDRKDADQLEWETKKAFVNTVRVQTLDRFQNQKAENGQRELASQWAPHRRARREVHQQFDIFTNDLDSMPIKELKKVLTSTVLKSDREAMRAITKRIQAEETWKAAWKDMEKDRRDDIRSDMEQRIAYNDMLAELSGQPPRLKDPSHKLPNECTPRLEEMARPTEPKPPRHVTQLNDYRGLYHVDHALAMEVRFPGQGHDFSMELAERATASSKPSWPPPPRFETPAMAGTEGPDPVDRGGPATASGASRLRRSGIIPVPKERLDQVTLRNDDEVQAHFATEQRLTSAAPPAPDQRKTLLVEPMINDTVHMGLDMNPRDTHTSRLGSQESSRSQVDVAPPRRDLVYPVVVPTVEDSMVRPNWRPKRLAQSVGSRPGTSADPRRRNKATAACSGSGGILSAREPRRSVDEAVPPLTASARLSMPGAEPKMGTVCGHLDEFEANMRSVPHIGNFWMTPRDGARSGVGA